MPIPSVVGGVVDRVDRGAEAQWGQGGPEFDGGGDEVGHGGSGAILNHEINEIREKRRRTPTTPGGGGGDTSSRPCGRGIECPLG